MARRRGAKRPKRYFFPRRHPATDNLNGRFPLFYTEVGLATNRLQMGLANQEAACYEGPFVSEGMPRAPAFGDCPFSIEAYIRSYFFCMYGTMRV